MQRTMLKSKIHRATVTDCDLHYVGSITIDPELLEAADIREFEQVAVVDVDNGARFETYTIAGERGSGRDQGQRRRRPARPPRRHDHRHLLRRLRPRRARELPPARRPRRTRDNEILTVDHEVATLLGGADRRLEEDHTMSAHPPHPGPAATSTSRCR